MLTCPSIVGVAVVVLVTSMAAYCGLRGRRFSNYLTMPALVLGFLYQGLASDGLGLGPALAGFTVGFGLLLLPWTLGQGGMRDIKLLATLGVWLGPMPLLVSFAGGIVLLAVLAVGTKAWAKVPHGWNATHPRSTCLSAQPEAVPFALAQAMSTWAILAWPAVHAIS